MRGKAPATLTTRLFVGITPAYAGKSPKSQILRFQIRDHPRLCGEKSVAILSISPFSGSPPPMRGKGLWQPQNCYFIRITPAYAGKSHSTRWHGNPDEDHPRLCGEKAIPAFHLTCDGGITPAYAGKSRQRDYCFHKFWDHPRLCGEKAPNTHVLDTIVGSPPPMRGKGGYYSEGLAEGRITPAYAGKRADNKKLS